MTTDDLNAALGAYGAGLEAELSLLRQLHRLALQEQQDGPFDYDLLSRISDERRRLMTGLLTLEDQSDRFARSWLPTVRRQPACRVLPRCPPSTRSPVTSSR